MASTTHELRRLLPDEPSDDENASSNLGTSFVRILAETRRAMPAPNPRVVEPTPPLPALPLGASIVPIAQLAHIGACTSDLRTLWSRSRARVQKPRDDADDELASATRERRRPFRSDDPSVDANLAHDRRGSDPGCFDRFGRSGRPGSSPALRDAPVVPLALVGRLRLPPSDDVSEGFLRLEDATGWTRVACLGLPDARALGRRVVATAWLRPRGGGAVEVASFEVLDADPTKPKTAIPMAEPADASDPAPPPARKGGFDAVGAVVAVSPAITLRGEDGAAPARFFMAELAQCPRCGRGPADGDDDVARRIMFKGESSATWRPFLGAATGGEFGDFVARASSGVSCGTACGCVRVTNLRKSALPHPRGKIRLALATSETVVSPNDAPNDPSVVAVEPPACACASCARGATLARLDAFVVGVDPTGAGVLIGGRRSSRGTPFLMTHAEVSRGRNRADVVASLRPGARVVITHAHPVWRVAAGVEPRDATEMKDDDEDEDHWGLRAVGACSRTRARVVTPSSADAPAPTLFGETETENRDSFASRVVSARTLRRACEEETFAGATRFRQLAAALRDKFDCAQSGGRRAASRLLLGKRARERDGGNEDIDWSDGFDLNLAIRALRGGDGGDRNDGNGRGEGDASIYHEFFLPSPEGMGGDETPIPKIPTLRAVSDAALAAFADASKRAVAAERDARRREGVVAKLPYGLNASAVDVDRLVASSSSLLGGEGALLLAWCRRRERPNGASVLRAVDDTIEIDLEIVDDDEDDDAAGLRARPVESHEENNTTGFPAQDAIFAATRWFAVVEGARNLAARDGRDPGGFPQRLARPTCRIRVHRRDVHVASNRSLDDPSTTSRAESRPTRSVSDASVWTPLDARGYFRGERPAPLGGIPSIDPNRDDSYLRPRRSPRRPTVAEPFVAVVAREFYATDFGGGWSRRLELRDVRGVESMLAYVTDTEGAIPIGVGAGAVVVFRDALRGVAARSFTVYLKFQAKTRVEVLTPSTATLAFPGESGVPTGVGVPPPTEPPARVTLAELCYGARRGIGAIDQRAWETRARIVSVASLVARWGCRRCGCDAGSIGAAAAAAAAESAAATADADARAFDAAAFLADTHGCEACRPAPGRPAATSEACGFEAEIFATMCDGGAQVEITVSGDAGAALIPPGLTSELLRLTREHGRVSAKLAKSAGDSYASHDVLGYAGRPVGEREGAAMLAAVGHLTSLGEMIFTVKLKYAAHDAGSDGIGAGPGLPVGTETGTFGATSAASAATRTITVGGVPTSTLTEPFVRVRVLDVKRAEPLRDAARALAEMERRRRG